MHFPDDVHGKFRDWNPPANWLRLNTIDMHTGGEPLRVILHGFPIPEGRTILERRRNIQQHSDELRKALMWEPRGHADMYGLLPGSGRTSGFGFWGAVSS